MGQGAVFDIGHSTCRKNSFLGANFCPDVLGHDKLILAGFVDMRKPTLCGFSYHKSASSNS